MNDFPSGTGRITTTNNNNMEKWCDPYYEPLSWFMTIVVHDIAMLPKLLWYVSVKETFKIIKLDH